MLKILVYDTNFVKELSRIIPVTKINYWQKHGCKVTILCTEEGKDFYSNELKDVDFIPLNYKYHINGPYSLPLEYTKITFFAFLKLKQILGNFDIVYSQSSVIDFLFVPWILKLLDKKIRWFVMVDNTVPSPNKRPGPFLQKLIPYLAFLLGNILLKKADGIFVVTSVLKNYYQDLKMQRVIKTNNGYGIQTEIFQGVISNETPKVNALYCGRIHLAKGIMDLVEVINLITKIKPDFKIGILGDGDSVTKKTFYEKIKKYGLENNFINFGYISGKEKGDIYRKSDFFLFLSYDEGCPHAVIEAFACNKPVIAYDLPIYHEIFTKYIDNGQLSLFKIGAYENIASYILNTDFKKKKFSNKLEDYSWEIICQRELEVMRNE